MPTFESVFTEYLRLSKPQFVENNPTFPVIFSASAVSLASKMWVDASDLIPSVWYIALIGAPRSGKTSFLRGYTSLLEDAGLLRIPEGSPEAMLMAISEVQHGFIFYDEAARLAKLLNSYMGVLPTILNMAYYLDTLSQIRTDRQKSVIVPARQYFIHTYFSGTSEDWASVENQAPGGFVRRTLVLPTRGIIPFFRKRGITVETRRHLARLRSHIVHILKELRRLELTVILPEYPFLASKLESVYMPLERKSMIEEYTFKFIAGRIVGNLIEVNPNSDPNYDLSHILNQMERRATSLGIKFDVISNTSHKVEVILEVPEPKDPSSKGLEGFVLPEIHIVSFNTLLNATRRDFSVPAEAVARNIERIREWVESGGDIVISKTKFISKVFNVSSKNIGYYDKLITLMEEGGYIRTVSARRGSREYVYIILDPKARICGNCRYYGIPKKCPLIPIPESPLSSPPFVDPKTQACEKFELVEGDEE